MGTPASDLPTAHPLSKAAQADRSRSLGSHISAEVSPLGSVKGRLREFGVTATSAQSQRPSWKGRGQGLPRPTESTPACLPKQHLPTRPTGGEDLAS